MAPGPEATSYFRPPNLTMIREGDKGLNKIREDMRAEELKNIAEFLGIKVSGLGDAEMLRVILEAEGYSNCFGIAPDGCKNATCLIRDVCIERSQFVHYLC